MARVVGEVVQRESEHYRDLFSRIGEVVRQVSEQGQRAWGSFAEKISFLPPPSALLRGFEQLSAALPEIARLAETFSERTKVALIRMAECSWYCSMEEIPAEIFEVGDAIQAGDQQLADKLMCQIYDDNYARIKTNILTEFPQRKAILEGAFSAHERGEYALSILAFLSQADGVCFDLLGFSLYAKFMPPGSQGRNLPRTAEFAKKLPEDNFFKPMMEPFASVFPISEKDDNLSRFPHGLNRHIVMHGKSLDYGTRVNGFKALSLLTYVCSVIKGAVESVAKHNQTN